MACTQVQMQELVLCEFTIEICSSVENTVIGKSVHYILNPQI